MVQRKNTIKIIKNIFKNHDKLLSWATVILAFATILLVIVTIFLVYFDLRQTKILDKQTEIMEEIKVSNQAELIINFLNGNIIKRSLYVEGGNELFLLFVNTGRIPSGNIRYWYGDDRDITQFGWKSIENLGSGNYNKTKIRMRKDCKANTETCNIELGRIYNLKIDFHCDLCKPQNDYYEVPLCFFEDGVVSYQECESIINNFSKLS